MYEDGLLNTYFSLIQVLLIEFNDLIISYENQSIDYKKKMWQHFESLTSSFGFQY